MHQIYSVVIKMSSSLLNMDHFMALWCILIEYLLWARISTDTAVSTEKLQLSDSGYKLGIAKNISGPSFPILCCSSTVPGYSDSWFGVIVPAGTPIGRAWTRLYNSRRLSLINTILSFWVLLFLSIPANVLFLKQVNLLNAIMIH